LKINCALIITLLVFPSIFTPQQAITHTFRISELREYLPISTNNITADKIYGRISETENEVAYEYLFYWDYQKGSYKFAEHNHDWEFVVVYAYKNGTVNQVNYDSWHYYIGRKDNPEAYNDTNVLLFVDSDFHYFKPDWGIRRGNVSKQINNQTIYKITDSVLSVAQEQVSFDPELFNDPFSWKEQGFLGRYTAFDDWWKAFWVVMDKKLEFVDLSDEERLITKWL